MEADLAGFWCDESAAGGIGIVLPLPLETQERKEYVLHQYPDGDHVCDHDRSDGSAGRQELCDEFKLGCRSCLRSAVGDDPGDSVRCFAEDVPGQ